MIELLLRRSKSSGVTNKGYFMGGQTTGYFSVINGIDFLTEAAISPTSTLSLARSGVSGLSSSTKGYGIGGQNGAVQSLIDGIVFSNQSSFTSSSTLSTARAYTVNTANYANGYIFSGATASNGLSGMLREADKIVFSTESISILSTTLLPVAVSQAQLSKSTTNAYVMGGYNSLTEIQGMALASETAINPAAILSNSGRRMGAYTYTDDNGYMIGGYLSSILGTLNKFVHATETSANLSATISPAKMGGIGVCTNTSGYIGGGYNTTYYSSISKLDYSTETISTLSATIGTGRYLGAGVWN